MSTIVLKRKTSIIALLVTLLFASNFIELSSMQQLTKQISRNKNARIIGLGFLTGACLSGAVMAAYGLYKKYYQQSPQPQNTTIPLAQPGPSNAPLASNQDLDWLEQYSYENHIRKLIMGGELTCPNCLEILTEADLQDIRLLPCSHIFHTSCLEHWLVTNQSCPICRAKTKPLPDNEAQYQKDLINQWNILASKLALFPQGKGDTRIGLRILSLQTVEIFVEAQNEWSKKPAVFKIIQDGKLVSSICPAESFITNKVTWTINDTNITGDLIHNSPNCTIYLDIDYKKSSCPSDQRFMIIDHGHSSYRSSDLLPNYTWNKWTLKNGKSCFGLLLCTNADNQIFLDLLSQIDFDQVTLIFCDKNCKIQRIATIPTDILFSKIIPYM